MKYIMNNETKSLKIDMVHFEDKGYLVYMTIKSDIKNFYHSAIFDNINEATEFYNMYLKEYK